eukprot:Skav210966  [mRNA]  locus=scaffold2129:96328:97665:+ [translate_table: standard]
MLLLLSALSLLWNHLTTSLRPAVALVLPKSTAIASSTHLLPALDLEKLKECAPKPLGPGELDRMLKEAKEFKKTYPKKINPRRVPDEQGRWRCNKCGQMHPVQAFSLRRNGCRHMPTSHCKQCHREECRDWLRTLRGNLQRVQLSARSRSMKELHSFSLSWDDLYEMVKCQRGRCAYSGVPLELCKPNSHWRMSLERKNNSRGYSRENCALIAAEFNTGDFSRRTGVDQATVRGTAQWSPQKVQAVFDLRQQMVDLEALRADIQEARQRPKLRLPGHQAKLPGPNPPEPGQIYCRRCFTHFSPDKFAPSEHHPGGRCRVCKRKYNQAYSSTLRGHISNSLRNARSRAKSKGLKCSLTPEHVLDMLERQSGRCFYSGVPLEYKRIHRNWRMSLERLDNSKGYTAQNCALIAIEFNTSDRSRNKGVTKVFGTSQWSREKVEHIWGNN